ncbi:MAG: DUF1223 domain-containing protein [Arenicellales bacterium]
MIKYIWLLLCALVPLAGPTARAGPTDHKHVVELFTSQSCYSCPPADRLLGRLIRARSDVVGLEFHVDYWNDLRYGGAGSWTDPFSHEDYTRRQQRYEARGLEGNNGVYTPQAVVNGRTAVVGSDERALDRLLAGKAPMAVNLVVSRGPASVKVAVSGQGGGPAEVWLYQFDVRKVTRIGGGENHGKTLTNHNIVRRARRLGVWSGNAQVYSADDLKLDDGQGCAIVVQRPDQGPILGADLCPS